MKRRTKEDIQKLDFEEAFERLEEIIELLENDDIPLDESIELFKEGVELYKHCKSKLDEAKLVIKDIMQELEKETENRSNEGQVAREDSETNASE